MTVNAVVGKGCKKSGIRERRGQRKALRLLSSLLQPCSLSANRAQSARRIERLVEAYARSSWVVGNDMRGKVFGISPSTKNDEGWGLRGSPHRDRASSHYLRRIPARLPMSVRWRMSWFTSIRSLTRHLACGPSAGAHPFVPSYPSPFPT